MLVALEASIPSWKAATYVLRTEVVRRPATENSLLMLLNPFLMTTCTTFVAPFMQSSQTDSCLFVKLCRKTPSEHPRHLQVQVFLACGKCRLVCTAWLNRGMPVEQAKHRQAQLLSSLFAPIWHCPFTSTGSAWHGLLTERRSAAQLRKSPEAQISLPGA